MNIIEQDYNFRGSPGVRSSTTEIILHHAAAIIASALTVNGWHKGNGWIGIGYHFYITKDGQIYRGRAEHWIGAHAVGHNANAIGICFEGNFENESPTAEQIATGKELVAYLRGKYGNIPVKGHRDVNSTSCPGRNFPMGEFTGVAAGGSANSVPASGGTSYSGVLKKGSQGDAVRRVQQKLKQENCPGDIVIDGIFGGATEKGVTMYQQYYKLAADGTVGQNTWNHMFAGGKVESAPAAPQPAPPNNRPTFPGWLVKRGQKGETVRMIQNRLNAVGYNCGAADADFGGKTYDAVVRFQRNNGLSVDGVVGLNTWNKLF